MPEGETRMSNIESLRPVPARRLSARLAALAAAAWFAGAVPAARAELGGNAATARDEAQPTSSRLQVTPHEAYAVHERRAADGAIVRQYLDRRGFVFAVAWRSSGPADLAALLGRYYPTYRALGARRIDLHHAALHTAELVVETGGVLRTFTGRAYLPRQFPAGVDVASIR